MRPIFSPSEFIQIKGRGTRRHNFAEEITDKNLRSQIGEKQKTRYKLFDFFANCEYFEEKFNYDEKLALPKPRSADGKDTPLPPPSDLYTSIRADALASIAETEIGADGMKIDRMYFERFEERVLAAVAAQPELKTQAECNQWDEVLSFVEAHILNKPEDFLR
jgi:type I restriction enzyme R subunit